MRARVLFAAALMLAACGSTREEQPGIGRSSDAYKRSPCACAEIPQSYPPGWLEEFAERLGT